MPASPYVTFLICHCPNATGLDTSRTLSSLTSWTTTSMQNTRRLNLASPSSMWSNARPSTPLLPLSSMMTEECSSFMVQVALERLSSTKQYAISFMLSQSLSFALLHPVSLLYYSLEAKQPTLCSRSPLIPFLRLHFAASQSKDNALSFYVQRSSSFGMKLSCIIDTHMKH